MKKTKQPWDDKQILIPSERLLRKAHQKKIRDMFEDSALYNQESEDLQQMAEDEKKAAYLKLPRIALTRDCIANYAIKIAAARHKEALLERMSFQEIKVIYI